ncbi:MAG: DUF4293 domain-containing protein [Prevotella sp.]|nr:DUF4293 domain-containing protein [Prevotella sp.]
MIQRKQTVFLLLALVATVCCLCMPLGTFETSRMGADTNLYNLWAVGEQGRSYAPWPLFAVLLLSCPLNVLTIISYNNRRLQMRLCAVCMALMVMWGATLFFMAHQLGLGDFRVGFASALPIVAFILYFMARRGVISDEKLVRAADRIR